MFDHFYVMGPKATKNYMAITLFKIIEGHPIWYQSKVHMRLPISD